MKDLDVGNWIAVDEQQVGISAFLHNPELARVGIPRTGQCQSKTLIAFEKCPHRGTLSGPLIGALQERKEQNAPSHRHGQSGELLRSIHPY